MSDNTYNGWRNYATWRVNLELVEDYLTSIAEDVEAGYMAPFADTTALADFIEQYVDDVLAGEFSGHRTDDIVYSYASAFVADVDWREIAEHWGELIKKEDDETEEEETDS